MQRNEGRKEQQTLEPEFPGLGRFAVVLLAWVFYPNLETSGYTKPLVYTAFLVETGCEATW